MGHDEPGRAAPGESSSGIPATVLENVFDDPAHGEPGRDRLAVHVVWEILLLVALAVATWLLWQEAPDTLRGDGLRDLLGDVVVLGLLTLAAGLSLRAATVNLAIGPVAVAAALHMAEQSDRGVAAAIGPTAALAAIVGLALALAVVVLHVPAWAAGLAVAAGVIVWIEQRATAVVPQGTYDPERDALPLFAGFAAVAVLGGVFGAVRAVRRLLGRFRPVADPARRRGAVAALVAVCALVGSTVLAMLAGLLLGSADAGPVAPETGLDWTVLAVGTSLLAGTSAYGRRGGVFGTLLAVSLVTIALAYTDARGWTVDRWALGAVALGLGLGVTRLVEAYGRPGGAREPHPVSDGRISTGWTVSRPDTPAAWPPALPDQSAEEPVDPWDVARWESGPRRRDGDDR
ncbi:ABC transporter permease [Micromonospora endolithica]|uniref:ABC transporter permease n=2 Tax=Micromonospora endolithica TaxID=230091 RepID=A0A3A9Z3A6_9ACTN|nr:ABC transporter permease [Micromonospora endolithica]TWJ25442.1 monosaccharide ABC transporter membrane protein (CUT2 family) [Micromonospora endolithica]